MNSKLLATTTFLFTLGLAFPAISADKEELSIFMRTGECIDCNLSGTVLENKNLKNTNLQGANLFDADFAGSDLRNANFQDANIKSVDFGRSDLRNADFSYADVSGAYFCNADLRGVNWQGVIYNSNTSCLPDEAINFAPAIRSNSNYNRYNNSPSNSDSRSISEDLNSVKKGTRDVKETMDTVKDIINFF